MEEKKEKIYSILSYICGGLSFVVAVLFFVQLIRIYNNGQTPIFSPENVGDHLILILPFIILFILFAVFVGVYSTIYVVSKKEKFTISNQQKYKILISNFAFENDSSLLKECKLRLWSKIIDGIIILCSLIFMIIYTCLPSTLTTDKDITNQIIDLFIHYSPFIIVSIVATFIAMIINEYSYARSNKIINSINKQKQSNLNKSILSNKTLWIIKGGIICLAIALIIVGICNNEVSDVLAKAVNICSECIGLG